MTLAQTQFWAVLGFAGVILGSFLPWSHVGILTVSGTDGDGVMTLILAAVGLILVLRKARGAAIGACALAVVVAVIGFYDAFNISVAMGDLKGNPFGVTAHGGSGLYLVIGASLLAAGASYVRQAELARAEKG